jgi:hypothetical protein
MRVVVPVSCGAFALWFMQPSGRKNYAQLSKLAMEGEEAMYVERSSPGRENEGFTVEDHKESEEEQE